MSSAFHQIEADLQPLSRRTLLKGCVSVGAGVAALGTLGCSDPALTETPHLNAESAAVFLTLARVMFPANDQLFPAAQVDIQQGVDHLLGMVDPGVRGDLGIAVSLFEYGAIVLGWHFSRFSKLDDQAATEYVDRWQNGNDLQRGIATALKKLVYTAYWVDARTWEAVAFDGPVSEKWGLEKLGNAPMPTEQGA